MLGDKKVIAMLPATDMERVTDFYVNKLGLKANDTPDKDGLFFEAGEGTGLFVYKRGETKADHTVAGFGVDDLEKEVDELRNTGVVFEEYNMPEMGIKTENGIAASGDMKTAWFKDSEGNILAINQMPE